ncbi:MAG: response regulator [Anaerolineae bacterium]|nr:response regulator [Anaerolineae bacterium]
MAPTREFIQQVADAYEHLYDLVYLRTHPLLDLAVPTAQLQRKDKAWQLHRLLLQAIDELDPGAQAPPFSHEWRRHRLMVLRYMDGADPQSAADQLAISRRHLYRELDSAIEAIATVLWERYGEPAGEPSAPPQETPPPAEPGLELLRLEAARIAQAGRYARLGDVTAGVLGLLQEVLRQRELEVCLQLQEGLPGIPVDKGLLRHMLLAMLGYLIERTERAAIVISAVLREAEFRLKVAVVPAATVRAPSAEDQERFSALEEMAALAGARVAPLSDGESVVGFEVHVPAAPRRTILVVDDNEDVLALFHRYLACRHYHVVLSQTAEDALAQARRLQPFAITLDLMMPDQDGWDILQTLLNQPETRHIPLIVCSVLKQKELALSLGATAFLEKPVSEQALIAVLGALESA